MADLQVYERKVTSEVDILFVLLVSPSSVGVACVCFSTIVKEVSAILSNVAFLTLSYGLS